MLSRERIIARSSRGIEGLDQKETRDESHSRSEARLRDSRWGRSYLRLVKYVPGRVKCLAIHFNHVVKMGTRG